MFIYCDECPKEELLKPRSCHSYGIHCIGNETTELKTIFHCLSLSLENRTKHFQRIYLSNYTIDQLPENTFEDIIIDSITIGDSFNLTLIHTNAFNASNSYLKELSIEGIPLKNSPNDHIFLAIRSMVNLENFTIINTQIDEIPDNAFHNSNEP